MLRSLYKNLRISSFVQRCYENYSAMQSNKRFNYSLVVPLLLLMWRVVLRRPGRDNWGIWVEYSAVAAAHLGFFSYLCVCHCLVSPEGWKAQQSSGEKHAVDHLKHVRTLQGKRTSHGGLANPRWLDPASARGSMRMKPLNLRQKDLFSGLV